MADFLQGLFAQNIALSKALGLALFVFLPYTLRESLWVSLRYALLMAALGAVGLVLRPFFSQPVYLLPCMAGFLGMGMVALNALLPESRLGTEAMGIFRRGDTLAFLSLAALLDKNLPLGSSLLFSLGQILGMAGLLILTAFFLEAFHFRRPLRAAAWRMAVLSVLSFLFT